MDKKKLIVNTILMVILIILVVAFVILEKKINKQIAANALAIAEESESESEPELTKIVYDSEIGKIGYSSSLNIVNAFAQAYNEQNGELLVSIMDLVAQYIYNEEAEADINQFDEKYVDMLSDTSANQTVIFIMQSELPSIESTLISNIANTNVTITIEDYTEIEDVTNYVSKFTADIRTVSEAEEIDQVDTVEFLLLKEDSAYYIFDYYAVDENGEKLSSDLAG